MAPGRLVSHDIVQMAQSHPSHCLGRIDSSYRNLEQVLHGPLMPSIANEAFSSLTINIWVTVDVCSFQTGGSTAVAEKMEKAVGPMIRDASLVFDFQSLKIPIDAVFIGAMGRDVCRVIQVARWWGRVGRIRSGRR